MRHWAKRAVLTRIVCALALFMLGFSSHAMAGAELAPHSLQYQLPDGSYASLCSPDEGKGGTQGNGKHCDVCVMSVGHLLTPPDAALVETPEMAEGRTLWPEGNANLKRILSHHGQSRGPPLNA
jgi:hypothetical protein